MYKYSEEKNMTPPHFLKKWFASKEYASFPLLAQMPLGQLTYFLIQAEQKQTKVILQMNKGTLCPFPREEKGTIKTISDNGERIFLNDGKKTAIIHFKELRHIRLEK